MKAIFTHYVGPTNRRGSRIIATDGDGNRLVIPYDHSLPIGGTHRKAAEALRDKMGWTGKLIEGENGNVHCFVFKP